MSDEAPDAVVPAGATPTSTSSLSPLVFTGSGSEYFRIWVVNTVLTIATLGIYSAWAKVRKSSYFARNTRLLGDGFEFTADPLAILRGRVLALALLGFYTFAFDFSLTLGLIATTLLLAAAPLLFASAMRFRLHNTRWRAMRFEFTARLRTVYQAVLIVALLWVSTTVAAALGGGTSVAVVGVLSVLSLPWMHHRLKAFQHGHVAFAGAASVFRPGLLEFYGTYVVASVLLAFAGIVGAIAAGVSVYWLRDVPDSRTAGFIGGIAVAGMGYVAAWPYFAARIQRTVWDRTTLGSHSFTTTISSAQAFPIVLKNAALLLMTAGLYWPYASISWARYRIGCMSIVSPESPAAAIASLEPRVGPAATGEGAIDFFGIDIGW